MSSFIRRFLVALLATIFAAGVFLSERIIGVTTGDYLLYTAVPFLLGMMVFSSFFERSAGFLAFFVVLSAIFAYLLLYDRNISPANTYYLMSGIGFGAGAFVYFLQVRQWRRRRRNY